MRAGTPRQPAWLDGPFLPDVAQLPHRAGNRRRPGAGGKTISRLAVSAYKPATFDPETIKPRGASRGWS